MPCNQCPLGDCGCARPCCYYQNPSCCAQGKPCCPPQPPPLPCCPAIPLPNVGCLATVPPCLRACPTCPCRKRIMLGKRAKRHDALHCQPGAQATGKISGVGPSAVIEEPARAVAASTKTLRKVKTVPVSEDSSIEAPPRAGRLYEQDRARRVKRSG
ncbi:hypothetical protein OSTOST_10467, partial [Ostertagia ostertagi]